MHKQSLIAFSVAAVLSTSGMAIEITNGKLLSHKEWHTGNIRVSFTENTNPATSKRALLLKKSGNAALVNIDATNFESNLAGFVNVPFNFHGNTAAIILNQSSATKTYTVETGICIDSNNNNSDCAFYADLLQVDPEGYAYIQKNLVITQTFNQVGEYAASVITTVTPNENPDTVFTSTSSSYINIADASKPK